MQLESESVVRGDVPVLDPGGRWHSVQYSRRSLCDRRTQTVAPAAGIAMFIGVAVVSRGIPAVWVMQLFLMFRLGTAMKSY